MSPQKEYTRAFIPSQARHSNGEWDAQVEDDIYLWYGGSSDEHESETYGTDGHNSEEKESEWEDTDSEEKLFTSPSTTEPIVVEKSIPSQPTQQSENKPQAELQPGTDQGVSDQQHVQDERPVGEEYTPDFDYTAYEHEPHTLRNEHVLGLKYIHARFGHDRANHRRSERPEHIDEVLGSFYATPRRMVPPGFGGKEIDCVSGVSGMGEGGSGFVRFHHLRLRRGDGRKDSAVQGGVAVARPGNQGSVSRKGKTRA